MKISNSVHNKQSVWNSFKKSRFSRYTKYLYPYECTKKNLSNPNDLAAAIEGNKREGRRGSYGAYHEMGMGMQVSSQPGMMPSQISPMSLVTGPPRFNGNGNSHAMPPSKYLLVEDRVDLFI